MYHLLADLAGGNDLEYKGPRLDRPVDKTRSSTHPKSEMAYQDVGRIKFVGLETSTDVGVTQKRLEESYRALKWKWCCTNVTCREERRIAAQMLQPK